MHYFLDTKVFAVFAFLTASAIYFFFSKYQQNRISTTARNLGGRYHKPKGIQRFLAFDDLGKIQGDDFSISIVQQQGPQRTNRLGYWSILHLPGVQTDESYRISSDSFFYKFPNYDCASIALPEHQHTQLSDLFDTNYITLNESQKQKFERFWSLSAGEIEGLYKNLRNLRLNTFYLNKQDTRLVLNGIIKDTNAVSGVLSSLRKLKAEHGR